MQKVVGSSPIIRSEKAPQKRVLIGPACVEHRIGVVLQALLQAFCPYAPNLRQSRSRWRDNPGESAKCLKEDTMKAKVGDRIVVEAEKVGQSTRTGVVEEVLAPEPPRLRVRWDDGHSTVFAPTAGAARIEPTKR
jgi:hypothetical protein